MLLDPTDPPLAPPAEVRRIPECNTITAPQVNSISHATQLAVRRTRRLNRAGDEVKQAMKTLAEHESSLSLAMTPQAVDEAALQRRRIRTTVRQFEQAGQKDRTTVRLRTKRAWNKLGAAERRFVKDHHADAETDPGKWNFVRHDDTAMYTRQQPWQRLMPAHYYIGTPSPTPDPADGFCSTCLCHHLTNRPEAKIYRHDDVCPKSAPVVLPVMFIGDAGTAVGARIKGHAKRGGRKLRIEHMAHVPTIITDEYNTSRTCCYCCQEVELARARRIYNGKDVMVRVHGTVECKNSECPSFKVGYTQKARDPHAALAIAITGGSALQHPFRQAPAPFRRVPLTPPPPPTLKTPALATGIFQALDIDQVTSSRDATRASAQSADLCKQALNTYFKKNEIRTKN